MTTEVETGGRSAARWPARLAGWARLALGLGWVVLLVLTVGLGERESSLADLEDAVRAGEVHEVVISQEPGPGWGATVELHWQDGLRRYSATVVEKRQRQRPTVESRLYRIDPGVTVIRHESYREGVTSSLLGQRPTGGAATALLALWLSTLLLLVVSPPPWRATRWAWFWLMWLPAPLGQLAYLLLSGPTPFLPTPLAERRLTGGRAFLLAIGLGLAANVVIKAVGG